MQPRGKLWHRASARAWQRCRHAAAAISLTATWQSAARAWSAYAQRGMWPACWLREPV